MACNRLNDVPDLTMDEESYLSQQLSPQSRPADFFNGPSDSVAPNWSYDGGMDMFAPNFIDMEPVPLGFADNISNPQPKQLFVNPFTGPSGISGLCIPMAEDAVSLSSVCRMLPSFLTRLTSNDKEFDSDDQSWLSATARPSIDFNTFETQTCEESNIAQTHSEIPTRYLKERASTAEIKQEVISTPQSSKSRKARSLSQDSNHSSASNGPKMRNAAKRAAHNIIEKRYRTNMNAKFVSLEQAISTSPAQKRSKIGAGCLKKSEILSNALSYIEDIQQENQALHKELAVLKQNRWNLATNQVSTH